MADREEDMERPADGIYGYSNGIAVTDEVIARVNENAEAGFPGTTPRMPGRPRMIDPAESGVLVQFRASAAKLRELDAQAEERHITRAEILREALDRQLLAA